MKALKLQLMFVLLLTGALSMVKAQETLAGARHQRRLQLAPTYNYLYSTHSTRFRGFGLNVESSVSKHIQLGAGAELIYCPYHYDNGLNLSELHLISVYGLLLRYKISGHNWLQPYFKVAT